MATTLSASASPAVASKRHIKWSRIVIALDGSGNGSDVVTFSPSFDNIPVVEVVPPLGVTGTFSPGTPTISGTTIAITGASLTSQNVEVAFTAHEKL